jgi:hypothetical protein
VLEALEPNLVFRSNQMIHSLRVRARQAAVPRGPPVNHVFDLSSRPTY